MDKKLTSTLMKCTILQQKLNLNVKQYNDIISNFVPLHLASILTVFMGQEYAMYTTSNFTQAGIVVT